MINFEQGELIQIKFFHLGDPYNINFLKLLRHKPDYGKKLPDDIPEFKIELLPFIMDKYHFA